MTTQAGVEYRNRFFRQRRESGNDLDWKGLWTEPFLAPLREARARPILELGCGTGNEAVRLAGEGYTVTTIDLSDDAIGPARATGGSQARFLVADMTRPLPFPSGDFDAVMSNVALHMFPDDVNSCPVGGDGSTGPIRQAVSVPRQCPAGPALARPAGCRRAILSGTT